MQTSFPLSASEFIRKILLSKIEISAILLNVQNRNNNNTKYCLSTLKNIVSLITDRQLLSIN